MANILAFEEGKWYYMNTSENGNDDDDKLAAKCIKDDGKYFHFSEYIRKSRGYKIFYGNWYSPTEVREFPESELAKWLPKEIKKETLPFYEIY